MIPLPNLRAAFVSKIGTILAPWNSYLQQFTQAPPDIQAIVVGITPFEYTAREPGVVAVTGGTVFNIILTRGLTQVNVTGEILIPVGINDIVTVFYTVLPTMQFLPSFGQNTSG